MDKEGQALDLWGDRPTRKQLLGPCRLEASLSWMSWVIICVDISCGAV